jgi:hypothetical protein
MDPKALKDTNINFKIIYRAYTKEWCGLKSE